MTGDDRQLPARMTATLFAEFDGRVTNELIADIVRTVLDERRQSAPDRAAEATILEARRRLECFIRAGSPGSRTRAGG